MVKMKKKNPVLSLLPCKAWRQLFLGENFNKHTVTLQVISRGMKGSCRFGFGSHLNCCCVVQLERAVLKARASNQPLGREARHTEKAPCSQSPRENLISSNSISYPFVSFLFSRDCPLPLSPHPLFLPPSSSSVQNSRLFPNCPTFLKMNLNTLNLKMKNHEQSKMFHIFRIGRFFFVFFKKNSPASQITWT